ncbi:MAG: FAD-linked oxidase C-terminal domain-containing protein [Acidimicrobiia bacterium]
MSEPDPSPFPVRVAAPAKPTLAQRFVGAAFEGFVRAALRTHVRMTVVGRENLPVGGFVVVSNHSSHLDAVVLMKVCGGRFQRFHLAAASDYFFGNGSGRATPGAPDGGYESRWGRLLRTALRLEPVPRGQLGGAWAKRDEVFENLAASCRRGDVVVYFPEGSRSPDGTIRRFRNGINRLGARVDRPVVPVYVHGAHALWPKGRRWTRRGPLTVVIGTPVPAAAPGGTPRPSLAARLEAEIRRLAAELEHPNRSDLPEERPMQHMKWWGWGRVDVSFTHKDKPALGPFVRDKIDIDLDGPPSRPIDFAALDISPPVVGDELAEVLRSCLRPEQVTSDPMDRVVHTYGKSLRDLIRIRRGDLGRLPDLIVYPDSEEQVEAIMTAALAHDAVLIPFGGGTNISESLEPPRGEHRTVVSVDMQLMDRVLDVDDVARTARVQAGVFGPQLEEQLNARGWTLGHFPDSFTHSTLGGWIATRSSGMQSDKYGDIADITKALRVVTPSGVLVTRAVPSKSTGPDLNQMMLGSEGRLGIITEATVQVHRRPEVRTILGYLFPDWHDALTAMAEIAESEASPSVTRVSDPNETQFSFATKKAGGVMDKFQSFALTQFLSRVKHYEMEKACLSFIGYEGTTGHVKKQRKLVGEIVSRHNGICVGSGPGEMYDQKKFDTPYIRDHLLNFGGLADVSETSASWSVLPSLYDGVISAANKAFAELGVNGWIMTHLSHSYHSGACLYFTFAFRETDRFDALEQYAIVKNAIQQAFIDHGGTLSHHHGVGLAHAPWLEQDVSPAGIHVLRTLFDGVDPRHQLNPGKIVD